MARALQWKFPGKDIQFLRVEVLFVGILAMVLFLFWTFAGNEQAVLYVLLFLLVYAVIAIAVQKINRTETQYAVKGKHLHITRKTLRKSKTEKVPLYHIARHKIDKLFLGGYVLTKKGKKHVLFFNTRKEAEAVERLLKKGVRSLRA